MDRDRSLEEFFGGESDGSAGSNADANTDGDSTDTEAPESDAGDDADTDAAGTATESADTDAAGTAADLDDDTDADTAGTAADPGDDEDDVEPAAVTYRWDPEGVRCADCGSVTQTLWSGESGPVCAECKEW